MTYLTYEDIIEYRKKINDKHSSSSSNYTENFNFNTFNKATFNYFYYRQYFKNYRINKSTKYISKKTNKNLIFLNIIAYLIFILIGFIIIISPTYSTIKYGIEKDENIFIKIFYIFIFTMFGLTITTFLIHNLLKFCAENNIKIKIKLNHDSQNT